MFQCFDFVFRMASVSEVFTPSVTWAQRTKTVFITINVPDVINPDIQVSAKKFLYVLLHYILGSREVTNFQRKITN